MKHKGQCHCGAIRIEFETDQPLAPRACQCGFCRRHGARTVTDREGSAVLALGGEAIRYRFGSGTTDFLICGRCGVYVGALAELDGQAYVTLNLNTFDDPRPTWPPSRSPMTARTRRRRRTAAAPDGRRRRCA